MKHLLDFFKMIDTYTGYLKEQGFQFTEDGYPVFTKEMFLDDVPDLIVPYNQRNNKRVKERKKTVLAMFTGDKFIYRRLDKLFEDIDEYKEFMGVVEADVTVTRDMDLEFQKATMLLNQLMMAVLASKGVKIILNTRMGVPETKDLFNQIPHGITVASGFLGGTRKNIPYDFTYLSKIICLMPGRVLIYGKCNEYIINQLNDMGIECHKYLDFRNLCKEVA